MRLTEFGMSRKLVWACTASLLLSSGAGQVLAAATTDADRRDSKADTTAAVRVGRVAALPIALDTGPLAGQMGRIVLRLRPDTLTSAELHVRWQAEGPLASGAAQMGEPVVVLEQAALAARIEDRLAFEVQTGPGLPTEPIVLVPEFHVETAETTTRLAVTNADGTPLRITLAPWQLRMEAAAPRWAAQAVEHEPLPAGVQPTGRGVRLQHDFADKRVAIAPEITDRHGLAVKAAVGAALSDRVALGIVGGGGGGAQDLVLNAGVQVAPGQRLLVSAGALQQETDLAFASGRERRRLRQTTGGAAYSLAFGGALAPRVDAQAYFADSGSVNLGAVQYFADNSAQAQIFRLDRRVAGARLVGAQSRSALQLGDATLTVSIGTERLRYAYATGDHVTRTLTRGVEWLQALSGGYSLQAYARTQAALHTLGMRAERQFGPGHRFGIELTHLDGRNGVVDDTQLRVTQTFAFGGRRTAAPQTRTGMAREAFRAPVSALLDEVATRPAFLPLVPLAVVDPTVRAERLVAVEHDGMVPGTSVHEGNGTVTVPAGAASIMHIAKNGAPFTNTGQFSLAGSHLQIHPMQMVAPGSGVDRYVVVLQNDRGGVTTATVQVAKGSIHVISVTLDTGDGPDAPDTTPDPFSFAPVSGAAAGSVVPSETITITGISGPTPISIVGGEYSIAGGPFTGSPGIILPGQTVTVRVQTPTTPGASATATLTVGDVSADFTVTTAPAGPPDTTPDPFAFTPQTGVAVSTLTVSNSVTVTGINAPAGILVSGGEYSISGGPFTSAPGTVLNGQSVRVRVTSSASFSTMTGATLTIGGVSAPFHVTTAAEDAPPDTTPDAFTFNPQTGLAPSTVATSNAITVGGINAPASISIANGEYSIDGGAFTSAPGTVLTGQTVVVRLTTASAFATTATATLTIGGVSGAFNATTEGADTTPDAFAFTPQTGVAISAPITSNSISVSGINAPTGISIVGGEYSIDGGTFTGSSGTVSQGQTVQVRVTSSASFLTAASATLTIGGVSGTFTATTLAANTTPDAFAFTPQTGVARSTPITSNSITVGGTNAPAAISIVGGEYSIDNGTFTSSAGTVSAGQSVQVRVTSSASFLTAASTTLTIGGVTGTFMVTTASANTTPDAFSFTPLTNVAMNTLFTSNSITVGGIDAPAAISVSGGEYRIGGGTFTSAAGTVSSGQTVQVRVLSSTSVETGTSVTLTIGGVQGTFTVTTEVADTTPNPFSFGEKKDVNTKTLIYSNTVTITGINTATPISIVNGEYQINGGAWTSAPGTINNNDQVRVRHMSHHDEEKWVTTTVTIGGVSGTFRSQTEDD